MHVLEIGFHQACATDWHFLLHEYKDADHSRYSKLSFSYSCKQTSKLIYCRWSKVIVAQLKTANRFFVVLQKWRSSLFIFGLMLVMKCSTHYMS